MGALEVARLMAALVWLAVAVTRSGSIWRVLRGQSRFYDILGCVIGGYALLSISFMVRWFLPGDTDELWIGLYLLSAFIALASLVTIARYESARREP